MLLPLVAGLAFLAALVALALLAGQTIRLSNMADAINVLREQRQDDLRLLNGVRTDLEAHGRSFATLVRQYGEQAVPIIRDIGERLDYHEAVSPTMKKARQSLEQRRAKERRIAEAQAKLAQGSANMIGAGGDNRSDKGKREISA